MVFLISKLLLNNYKQHLCIYFFLNILDMVIVFSVKKYQFAYHMIIMV